MSREYDHSPEVLLGTIRDLERRLEAAERAQAEAESARAEAVERLASWRAAPIFRFAARAKRLFAKLPRRRTAPISEAPRGVLEEPRDGQQVDPDRVVYVRGWVISGSDPVTRVEIHLDGDTYGNARLGVRRPDVGATAEEPEGHISGFLAIVELGDRSGPEEVKLSVAAITFGDQRHELGAATLAIPAAVEQPDAEAVAKRPPSSPRRGANGSATKLLVFTHALSLGGAQLDLLDLLRGLARSGFEGAVFAPRDGALREAIEAVGFDVIVDGGHPMDGVREYEGRQLTMLEWAAREEFDAVLANTLLAFPGVDLAARLGIPAVWAIHESMTLGTFWREAFGGGADNVDPVVRAHAERALGSASAVVFEAKSTRDLLVRHGDPESFLTIPYGIDLEAIDEFAATVSRGEARRRLELEPDATILLCLGTIEPRKGQALLARAFEVVAPDHPDARLVFVGGLPDVNTEALQQYLRGTGADRQITVKPVSPDIFDWYRAADALVIASDLESLPRTVLESMALGVPVIATRAFGLPELIDDGETGFLCEPRDVLTMAATLRRFLTTSPDERERLGAAGAALVHERHGLTDWTTAFARLLRGLVEDPSGVPSEFAPAGGGGD